MSAVRTNVRLAEMTTTSVRILLDKSAPSAVLVPVGSVEPHGPHLPLGTDTIISDAASVRAIPKLEAEGIVAVVAPAIPYGITCFAEGFAGAISVPATALTVYVRAVVEGFLDAGFSHVCLVNNHLEPAHDTAVRAVLEPFPEGRVSVACPLSRRWAKTLSSEFKSGACHAGRYETSLVLAAAPASVDVSMARALPELTISLSEGIKAGKTSFRAMGLEQAYTGAPQEASEGEGEEMLERLSTMIAVEVKEALASLSLLP